jgi:hypothetical protein
MYRLPGALLLLAWGLVASVQAQPATITLACKGTTTTTDETTGDGKPQPISMGIIVNFTTRTIQGFDVSVDPLTITAADDVKILFEGYQEFVFTPQVFDKIQIIGFINRVTGDAHAVRRDETKKPWRCWRRCAAPRRG